MGVYLSNVVKIGNILLSERDKFSFHFGLNLQLNLLTVPLCQSLMSSNKLNKIFPTSKLVSLLFKCSLLWLQLHIGFMFSLSMNPLFLLLRASLKVLFTMMTSSFKSSFQGTISEIIMVWLSFLHWWANPSMLSAIFPWSFSVFKPLLSQFVTIILLSCHWSLPAGQISEGKARARAQLSTLDAAR